MTKLAPKVLLEPLFVGGLLLTAMLAILVSPNGPTALLPTCLATGGIIRGLIPWHVGNLQAVKPGAWVRAAEMRLTATAEIACGLLATAASALALAPVSYDWRYAGVWVAGTLISMRISAELPIWRCR